LADDLIPELLLPAVSLGEFFRLIQSAAAVEDDNLRGAPRHHTVSSSKGFATLDIRERTVLTKSRHALRSRRFV